MTTKKGTKKPGAKSTTDELDAFAHHLAEVLRIARTSPMLPARLYNGIAEAWNDFSSDVYNLDHLCDSEGYIRLLMREQAQKGGAR